MSETRTPYELATAIESECPGAATHFCGFGYLAAFRWILSERPCKCSEDQCVHGYLHVFLAVIESINLKIQGLLEQHRELLRAGVPDGDPKRVALEVELRGRLGHFAATPADRLAQELVANYYEDIARPVTDADRAALRSLYEQRMREEARKSSRDP